MTAAVPAACAANIASFPPGDIRNCMVALSRDELLLGELFQYRFPAGRGLAGHSFGNLFLTALTNVTGDFPRAVQVSAQVLAIRGRIFPSTAQNVTLEAELENGKVVAGETNISRSRKRIARLRLVPRRVRPLPEVLAAIREADLILVGPGSLYTSILPNLLVEEVAEVIANSPGDARVHRQHHDAARRDPALLRGRPRPRHLRAHPPRPVRFRGDQSHAGLAAFVAPLCEAGRRASRIRRWGNSKVWA